MKSRFVMLSFSLSATSFILSACGSSSSGGNSDSGGGSSGTWSNTAMQTLVSTRCANSGCHDGTTRPYYKGISESSMKADTQALNQVNAGRMPQDGAFSTTDLATFKKFYNP